MTSLAVAPPQSPSPDVRIIRSQSFDSPFLRLSVTPVDESPFSKSTGSLKTLPSYNGTSDGTSSITAGGFAGSAGALPLLNTKASDASMLSEALSASFSSVATSPTSSESSMEPDVDEALSPSPSQEDEEEDEDEEEEQEEVEQQQQQQQQRQRQRPRPHPLAFTQSTTTTSTTHSDDSTSNTAAGPASPFLYQDTSCPMYSPWLVCAVLDMHDVRRLDWMSIADPIERVWGVRTSSADVLGILSDNGRVVRRQWRD